MAQNDCNFLWHRFHFSISPILLWFSSRFFFFFLIRFDSCRALWLASNYASFVQSFIQAFIRAFDTYRRLNHSSGFGTIVIPGLDRSLCVHFLNVSIMKNFSFFSHFLHFLFAISLAAFWTSPWGFVRHWFAQNRTESDRIALNLTTLVGQKKNFVVASARIAAHRIESKTKTKRIEWHLLQEDEGENCRGEGNGSDVRVWKAFAIERVTMSSSSMKRLSQVKVARNNTGADQESAREVDKLR